MRRMTIDEEKSRIEQRQLAMVSVLQILQGDTFTFAARGSGGRR